MRASEIRADSAGRELESPQYRHKQLNYVSFAKDGSDFGVPVPVGGPRLAVSVTSKRNRPWASTRAPERRAGPRRECFFVYTRGTRGGAHPDPLTVSPESCGPVLSPEPLSAPARCGGRCDRALAFLRT
eukprot:7378319-Prymnesium_polylepis.2